MAKMSSIEIVRALAVKGIEVSGDNPNLETIARGLGIITSPAHTAKLLAYSSKAKSEVPLGTDGANVYVSVSGGARGRDAWFPVKDAKNPGATLRSIAEACIEVADALTPAAS